MVALRDDGELIGYYEKHEYRDKETMKMYDLQKTEILVLLKKPQVYNMK